MFLTIHKKIMWFIVIWFAAMQMISPLMHGHVGTDSPVKGSGLHTHIFEVQQTNEKLPTFKNANDNLQTIGVDKALVKDLELLTPPILAILFFLPAITFVKQYRKVRTNHFTPHPFFLRPNSSPRAPPVY